MEILSFRSGNKIQKFDLSFVQDFIQENGNDTTASHSGAKRSFDIVFALVLLVLSSPIMLLTALCIKLESKGSIIYQQKRVGLNGQIFNIKKFRSMYDDAEADGIPRWASVRISEIS